MPEIYILEFDLSNISESIRNLVNNGLEFLEQGVGVTATSMLVQLIATLILFLAVRFLLWNKITAILEKRKQAIDEAFNAKEEALADALQISEDNLKLKEETKKEAASIIEGAKKRSYVEADKIISDAKEEAARKLATAEADIAQMKVKAENEIKEEIVDVAYLMATKVVANNSNVDEKAIKDALSNLESR